jgi:hypothetical protein
MEVQLGVKGKIVDIDTRRKKQQALIVHLVERKVRSRAEQIYELRGRSDGQELQDWFQAESEVLDNTVAAPLYRRVKTADSQAETEANASVCETTA